MMYESKQSKTTSKRDLNLTSGERVGNAFKFLGFMLLVGGVISVALLILFGLWVLIPGSTIIFTVVAVVVYALYKSDRFQEWYDNIYN